MEGSILSPKIDFRITTNQFNCLENDKNELVFRPRPVIKVESIKFLTHSPKNIVGDKML